MIAWEATAGPTVHRQGSRCARPAPPACGLDCAPLARLFAAMRSWLAVSDCAHAAGARSEHGSVMWRGLRPFSGSAKLATVAPWLPRKNRSHGMRRAARYSTISMTMWPRPLVLAVTGEARSDDMDSDG